MTQTGVGLASQTADRRRLGKTWEFTPELLFATTANEKEKNYFDMLCGTAGMIRPLKLLSRLIRQALFSLRLRYSYREWEETERKNNQRNDCDNSSR